MAIIIRPVAPTDRQVWQGLFEAYARFYKLELPQGAADTVWGWIFEPDPDFWCDLAADTDGNIIGLVQYQLMRRSLGGGEVCYLSDLYVEPVVRGSGAGRALIDHVLDFARTRGLAGVRWLTQQDNHQARKLYDTYQPRSDFILYNVPV
ncbi:hypothetical protein MNBD_ALPHA09-485 [hydrothermal vent metagenome]|uniref:N-acetyltransferase domain-containing protein n=1 Tax=hydrothermal vent metagenome TaxID=652676 RepID=A0A3B0UD51_9ZZZZ